MDSYLSGREQVGQTNKRKDAPQLGPKVMGELVPPPSVDSEVGEACGEGGSKVSYVSEEGRVTRIIVTCACGQVTEIDCRYED